MERIFRDGFNPYKHQTWTMEESVTCRFQMYRCACMIRVILFVRLGCILLQHVLLPWCGVGGDLNSDVLVMMLSDGVTLGGICFVYPERTTDDCLTQRRGRR